jgi:hypothetical protein
MKHLPFFFLFLYFFAHTLRPSVLLLLLNLDLLKPPPPPYYYLARRTKGYSTLINQSLIHSLTFISLELVVRRPGSGIHVRRVGGPVPGVPGDREIGRLGSGS